MPVSQRITVLPLVFLLLLSVLVLRAPDAAAASGPVGTIASPITDSGLDTNGDVLYDYLAIDVTVDVTSAGMFAIYVNLAQAVDVRAFLDVGLQTIQARVYGWSLYNAGFDGPYSVQLSLEDGTNLTVLDTASYTTGVYLATDFDPPVAILESVGTPWAVDTNGNGFYDELRLNYTLNVTDSGPYSLTASLHPSPGSYAASSWTDTPTVGVGVHHLVFSYPGGLVNLSHLAAPFAYALTIQQTYESPSITVSYPVSSLTTTEPTHSWYEFDTPWIRFGVPPTDHGVDLDGDALYEEIVVQVPVHLDHAGAVDLSGWLGPDLIAAITNVNPTLPAGDFVLNLTFPAFTLRERSQDGPYDVILFLTSPLLPGTILQETYATGPYNPTQFSLPSVALGTPGWTYADANGDGAAEFLNVGVNLTARKTGEYFIDGILWGAAWPGPMLETGRFFRLTAGTTVNVTLKYSGVTMNRTAAGVSSTLALEAWRLDALWGADLAEAWVTSPVLNASNFEALPHTLLNGTVRSIVTGRPVPYVNVYASDPSHAFWLVGQADEFGNYSLDLYPGTFTVEAESIETAQSAVQTITVDGAARGDLNLPPVPPSGYAWNATFASLNRSAVTTLRTEGWTNASLRLKADLFGNFDGAANASELLWALRYYYDVPYARPNPLPTAMGLGLSVDGTALNPGPDSYTLLSGAGSDATAQPVVVRQTTTFTTPKPPAASSTHTVKVIVPYDAWPFDGSLRLTLPPGYDSNATASANVALHRINASTWAIDPGSDPSGNYGNAIATLTASSNPDTTPPVAAFMPSVGERLVPVGFDGSGSTDNVGVTNYTWNVTANGTVDAAYGPSVQFTFGQIGTFVVTLTVRDAAGNAATVSHAVTVRDTTPPPTPTGLSAVVTLTAGGAFFSLTWNKVSADDLVAYRVYESLESGSTYRLAGRVGSNGTSFGGSLPATASMASFRVTSVDRYGNEGSPSASIPVIVPSSTGPPPRPTLPLGIVVVPIAVVGLAAGVAFLIFRSRRKKAPPLERGPVT